MHFILLIVQIVGKLIERKIFSLIAEAKEWYGTFEIRFYSSMQENLLRTWLLYTDKLHGEELCCGTINDA